MLPLDQKLLSSIIVGHIHQCLEVYFFLKYYILGLLLFINFTMESINTFRSKPPPSSTVLFCLLVTYELKL
jgi:hypothetical protein